MNFSQLIGRPNMIKRAEVERSRFYQYRLEEIEKLKEKEGEKCTIQQTKELLQFCQDIHVAKNWVHRSIEILDDWRRHRSFGENERERIEAKNDRIHYDKIVNRLKNQVHPKWLKELQIYLSNVHTVKTYNQVCYWPLSKLQKFMITQQPPLNEEHYVEYEMLIDRLVEREINNRIHWQQQFAQALKDETIDELAESVKNEFIVENDDVYVGNHPITGDKIYTGHFKTRFFPREKQGKELVDWIIGVYIERLQHLQEWRLDVAIPQIEVSK